MASPIEDLQKKINAVITGLDVVPDIARSKSTAVTFGVITTNLIRIDDDKHCLLNPGEVVPRSALRKKVNAALHNLLKHKNHPNLKAIQHGRLWYVYRKGGVNGEPVAEPPNKKQKTNPLPPPPATGSKPKKLRDWVESGPTAHHGRF